MAATYVLTEKVPQNIAQIDLVTIDTYELTLQEVCDLVKRVYVTAEVFHKEEPLSWHI